MTNQLSNSIENEDAKKFIEARLLKALLYLHGADDLNEATNARVEENQDIFESAMEMIGGYTEEITQLYDEVMNGKTVII